MIAYLRVSTDEQAANGHGLTAQRRQIEETCERRGWQLERIYCDEGASGKTLDRPELQKALTSIAKGESDGLIVAKLDRLSRSVIDFGLLLEWFDETQARLVALDLDIDTSTPGGRLVAMVFATVAQWERETIAQRTRDGMAAMRAKGLPISQPAVSDRPELVAEIMRLRSKGFSYGDICDRLNRTGVPTLRGGELWRPSAIQSVLGSKRRPKRRVTRLPEVVRR